MRFHFNEFSYTRPTIDTKGRIVSLIPKMISSRLLSLHNLKTGDIFNNRIIIDIHED